jgi:hypothetical protein
MGSTIKRKEGVCCVENCKRPIYSKKMCQEHYWKDNAKKNQEKKKANGTAAKKQKSAKELNIFFASQLLEVPKYCENNCGSSLDRLKNSKMRKAIIAHILPKREIGGFPSVATHPKNKLFLCLECHTDFDNKGADFAPTMDCFDLMCERFMEFKDQLSESDKQRLPFYFKDLLNIKY